MTCVNKTITCGTCAGQRNLCAKEHDKWDVFIAYYGGAEKGTQTQAEALFDRLNEQPLINGHKLKVYQHTRINAVGSYGITPAIVKNSSIFILLVDSNIPKNENNALLEFDDTGRKPLYAEVQAFRRSKSYNIPCLNDLPYCPIIVCDDIMTARDAEELDCIFQEKGVLRWNNLLKENFKSLLSAISQVLIGTTELPSNEITNSALNETACDNSEIKSTIGNIPVGAGAHNRLLKINGQSVPYESLIRGDFRINFSNEQFKPNGDVENDSNQILSALRDSSSHSIEANVVITKLAQIESNESANRNINRVYHIENMNGSFSIPTIHFQPIAYEWVLKLDQLDTPFSDQKGTTTLRQKYAHPFEQQEEFIAEKMMLASHTGCGTFIITKDGYLICSNRRGIEERRLSFFPGKQGYTVSGSFVRDDKKEPSDFIMDRIEEYLGLQDFTYELVPWEFGYEYEHLHYQFSFFTFYDGDKDSYINKANQTTDQAGSFAYYNLCDKDSLKKLATALRQPENWESAAWAMLSCALTSRRFKNKIRSMCNINFDTQTFYDLFSSNSNIE